MTKHRANGEGSLFKRVSKDGGITYCAELMLGYGPDGKRLVWRKSGKKQEEVRKALDRARQALGRGEPVLADKQTVGDYLAEWLQTSAKPSVRPNTFEGYEMTVRRHLSPALGHHRLAKLGPQHVQRFLADELAAGMAPRTVQLDLAILRRALKQAERWGLIARNVASLVDGPKVERPEMRHFSVDEARRFLAAIPGERLHALYAIAITLGLRQGEILGLRWQDVDLEAATLSVRGALHLIDGVHVITPPKTRRSARVLPLTPGLIAALRTHRERQTIEATHLGSKWGDTLGLVFTSDVGTPIDQPNLLRAFRRFCARHGLPDIRFHDLRHSCATLLAESDVPLRQAMEILGHSQIATTAEIYTHVATPMVRESLRRLDGLLSGPSEPVPVSFRREPADGMGAAGKSEESQANSKESDSKAKKKTTET